jgi:tetratricopeptide (TPR) repeat protein
VREDEKDKRTRFKELENDLRYRNGELVACPECNGRSYIRCNKCDGSGYKAVAFATDGAKEVCYLCRGTGNQQCVHCSGTGREFKVDDGNVTHSEVNENNLSNKIVNINNGILYKSADLRPSIAIKSDLGIGVRDCLTKAEQYQKDGDSEQAFKWYKIAADHDPATIDTAPIFFLAAQNNVAEYYRRGIGTPIDFSKSVFYYKKAADNGNGFQHCMLMLGDLYEKGVGVDKNITQAIEWYQKAVERNFEDSITEAAREALKRLKK